MIKLLQNFVKMRLVLIDHILKHRLAFPRIDGPFRITHIILFTTIVDAHPSGDCRYNFEICDCLCALVSHIWCTFQIVKRRSCQSVAPAELEL